MNNFTSFETMKERIAELAKKCGEVKPFSFMFEDNETADEKERD